MLQVPERMCPADRAAFREQMRLGWTERDQQAFALLIRTLATASRLLPAPVSRFPFNACLADLRLRRQLPARRWYQWAP